MTLWIGKVGSLVKVPTPHGVLDATWERTSTVKDTIGGGRNTSFAPGGRRMFKPHWELLTYDDYIAVEELYTGARGPGPWVVLDSNRRNHLTLNQAASGSVSSDTTGWVTLTTAETLDVATSPVYRGPRSIKWMLPTAGAAVGVLRLGPPGTLPGWPAPADQPWTWSARLLAAGVDPAVTVTPALLWMDSTGVPVGTTIGAPVALANAAFTQVSVTAATPAGACFLPELRVDLSTLSGAWSGFGDAPVRSGWASSRNLRQQAVGSPLAAALANYVWGGATADLYIDTPLLDMYAGVRGWAPGTGVPRCSWLSAPDVEGFDGHRLPVDAVLVEVG